MEAKLDAASGCVIIKGRGWNTGDKAKWQLCVGGCTLPVNLCFGLQAGLVCVCVCERHVRDRERCQGSKQVVKC